MVYINLNTKNQQKKTSHKLNLAKIKQKNLQH